MVRREPGCARRVGRTTEVSEPPKEKHDSNPSPLSMPLPHLASVLILVSFMTMPAAAQDLGFESDTLGAPPARWQVGGTGSDGFQVRVAAVGDRNRALRIERIGDGIFVMISARADSILKGAVAVRVRASLRADSVRSRISGIFVTLLDENGRVVATDNMNRRSFTGTRPWTTVETILPVLPGASRLEFGPTLAGRSGVLWADNFQVEKLTRDDVGYPSEDAISYAEAALDTLRTHALRRDSVDWAEVHARMLAGILGAQAPSETYDALADAARFVDRHSSFLPPERLAQMRAEPTEEQPTAPLTLPAGRLLADHIGYINVPGIQVLDEVRIRTFADTLISLLADLDSAGACGWIVDLRENTGGNMFPMLSGLMPLLGTDNLGYFVDNDGESVPWYVVPVGEEASRDGTAVAGIATLAHALRQPDAPVVALVGPRTTSSGEVVALSFRGRPTSILIGAPTGGFTTGNEFHELSDGAVFNITSSVYADRTGHRYGGKINPDIAVNDANTTGDPIRVEGTAAFEEALRWLGTQADCRE